MVAPMAIELMVHTEGKESWNESSANSLFVIFFEMSKIYHMSMSIPFFMGFKASMLIMVAPTAMQHGASAGQGIRNESYGNPSSPILFCYDDLMSDVSFFGTLFVCLQASWLLRGPSPLQAQLWYAFQNSRMYDSRLPSDVMCICRNLISIMAASRFVDYDYKQGLVYNDY